MGSRGIVQDRLMVSTFDEPFAKATGSSLVLGILMMSPSPGIQAGIESVLIQVLRGVPGVWNRRRRRLDRHSAKMVLNEYRWLMGPEGSMDTKLSLLQW